jgi:two-component system cell cycle sensor histidine kinase/response regulator CckA
MSEKEIHSGDAAELRPRAEEMARRDGARTPENPEALSPEEIRRRLHELRVHQIELEMQNEELRRAQVELDAARMRYFDLYDLAPVGYCTVSETGLILESNLTAARLLGVPRGALVKQLISRFILKSDQDLYYRHRKRLFETGELQAYELRMVNNDGAAFWVRLESTAAQAEDGKRVGRVVLIDITERKCAEEALARSLAEQKAVYDHSPVMMCVMDSDRRMLYANPAFTAFIGRSEGAPKGGCACGVLGCIDAPDDPRGCGFGTNCASCGLWQRLEDTLKTGTGRNFEHLTTLVRDGVQRRVTLLGSTSLMHLDDRTELLLCLHDVTEHKELEAQFQQAQKMESVGRLAGGVAHDFNNLLTVINGYSQMALDEMSESDPLRGDLAEIHKAGERASGLTRQLLAFSRKQVLQPRSLDLNRSVQEMLPMLERLLGEDVEVRSALNAENGTVYADPHQMEQVIMNLAVNARDAMPAGGKLLIETARVEWDESYTRSHPEVRAGRYVMLAVSDNGVGMNEETRQRIFEPFFTTKEVGQGTGLGLSMVQGIVAQSGGDIGVYSEPGQGTTFKIYLPALAKAVADDARPAAVPALGGKETVLVVEDQVSVRKYVAAALRTYGYRVIQAESAGEALLFCERRPERVDLVLTDVVMPIMSGRELAGRLETLDPGIKVLFMSGYTGNVIEHHGVLGKGAEYIQKPFSPVELAGKVRTVLGPPAPAHPGGRR